MFNKFIKKSSKFFAVLLTATLAFTPLSYAEPMTFADLYGAISSDGTVSPIEIPNNIEAATADTTLGEQALDSLTINGADYTVSGANSAYGMKIDAGSSGPLQEKITEINNIEFKNFYKDDDGSVIYNKAGSLTIKNSSFTANKGTGRGGAIYHKTKSDEQPEEHRYGSLTIQNSLFSGNEAFAMGAIHSEGKLTITDTVFENNKAEYMGVLGVTGSKKDKTTLTNVTFSNNSSTNNSGAFPNSGVIYLGGEANISIAGSTFENNTSAAEAGAIGSAFLDLGGEDPDFKNAKLDVTGSTFKKNTAQTNGGAIDNYFYGSEAYPTTNNETFEPGYVYVKDTTFEENKAKNGGAVYNHGNIDGKSVAQMVIDGATKFIKNIAGISSAVTGNGGAILNEGNLIINDGVEFSTNSASGKGGAIFNTSSGSEGGVIDFNGSATFVDNYTGSEDNKNDIYNDGTLNFNGNADGATVTMTGGIVGSGDTNIGDAYNTNNTVSVKLGSDAKLEQNIIYINQNSSLEGNAANIKATFGGETPAMYNEGSLVLFTNSADAVSFANNVYDPTRTGTTTVKTGANIDMGKHTLQQYGLTLEEDATLTVDANILELGESGSGVVTNNGNLIFKSAMATTPMSNINDISGTGKLTINGKVTNTENFSISQDNGIEIVEDGEFTAFADDIQSAVTVYGAGTYDITGGTVSYKVVGGEDTKGNVNIGTAEVKISSAIYKNNINISTSVILDKESYLGDSSETASDLTINTGAKIDMKNDTVGTATIDAITVNPSTEWTLFIDADLAAKTADNFVILDTENSSIGADSQATIDSVNFLSDFEEGQVDAKMQVANANINLQVADPLNIFKLYTTESSYDVSTINDETGSFLKVALTGLGTLPQAIYDGADEYSATRDEEVTAWIADVNTLSATLLIKGNDKTIKAAPESGVLEGINASTHTLTIDNLAGFEGFNNAITVERDSDYAGFLNVSTVTFKNNTGDAVIKNAGYTSLRNVTFEGNEVNADVENTGNLLITETEGVTTFEKGIVGIGTTTITGTTANFGNNAKFEQDAISIEEGSQVTVNAANVKITGVDNILYNSGSLVLYSTYTDTIDFASSIMDDISAGTTTIKTTATDDGNIGANINMGDNDLQQYGLVIEEDSSLTVNANKLDIEDQVVNDGNLIFKSATAEAMVNKSTITTNGTGSLKIDGNVTNQEGTSISQANIYVLENGSFTASANDLTVSSEDGISNEGELTFKSETDEQINENKISGNGKFFIDGSLINRAEVNQSSVTIGTSLESMAINEGKIVSTNVVINAGSTLVAKGEIDTYGDGEFENGKITNNGTLIINVLNEEGEPDTVPNRNTIDGTGTLRISSTNFNVQENATISQSAVIIEDVDSSLSVGVSSLTITNPDGAVQNAGKFILTGEGDNFNKVEGYNNINGEIVFDEGSEINNYANINQSTVTVLGTVTNIAETNITASEGVVINGDGSLTTSASDINGQIENNKDLIFNAGTNSNVIVGTGTLTINGVVVNGNAESTLPMITVSQSSVTISGADSQLYNVGEITTNYLTGDGNLENQGKLILNLSEDAGYGLASLTGIVGVSSITVESGKSVTLNNTGTIEQATIETYGDGTLVLTGNNIIANVVNYMTGNCLDIATRIVGTLDNNPANEETQGVVNILDGGSVSGLITNSTGTISIYTNFEVETGITSNNQSDITKNIINIGSATAAGVVTSSQTIEYQTITVSSGSLTMKSDDTFGIIDNSSIAIEEDGTLEIHVSSMTGLRNVETGSTEDAAVVNDGTLVLYGNETETDNSNSIINANEKGNLIIEGNINNVEGTAISQSTITVTAVSTFTANANNITTSAGIVNDGLLTFVGAEDTVNTSTITTSNGNGTLVIASSEVANSANITQKDITIETESELENNNATIIATSSMTVKENAVLENAGTVEAEYLINDGEIENGDADEEEGGTITVINLENNKTVTNSSGSINANVFNNNADANLSNGEYGVIVSTNLVNNGTIVSSGSITAYRTLANANIATITNSSGTITAREIISNGLIENAEDASIDAEIVYNDYGGTINSTGTITVSDTLTNGGMIASSGSITATHIVNEEDGVIENYGEEAEDGTYEGGTITSANVAVNKGTITSNASGMIAEIENSGIYNVTGGTVTKTVTGNGGIVNIKQSSVTVSKEAFISENEINLEGTQLKLEDESNLRSSILNIGEDSTLDIRNGETNDMTIRNINVAEGITWNYNFDVDLELKQSDLLKGTVFGDGSTMNIGIINVLADSDYTSSTDLEIADTFSNTNIEYASFATTQVSYTVEQLTGGDFDNATWIRIKGKGYGGLPQTVYDGIASYLVTGDAEGNDKVIKWVKDEDGVHDTLKADLVINATDEGKTLVASPEDPDIPLTGLKTDKYTLKINNDGNAKELTIKGFENALTVNNADGRLEVNKVVFSSNTGTAVITNEGATTLNGVTFTDNDVESDVINNGKLTLTGNATTFENGITGTGTTLIDGVAIDLGAALLVQNKVEINDAEGSSLTVAVDNLTDGTNTTAMIMNNGALILTGNAIEEDTDIPAELNTNINGVGNTTISEGAVTVGEDVTIAQKTINIAEGAALTAGADQIDTFAANGKIANNGELEFTGGTNNNVIDGEGLLFISGTVANSTGTKVSQQFIEVKEDAKFAMNADDVTTGTDGDIKGIQNNGDLEITGGTNKNNIGRGDGASGNVIISGDVINEEDTKIEQVAITVNEGANFTTNASDLETVEGITSNGGLTFTGGTNENAISGDSGILTIAGEVINNAEVSQSEIKIDSDAVFSSTASALTATNGITNNGTLKFDSGLSDDSNANNISGLGTLIIDNNTMVNNTGMIVQKELSIATTDSWLKTSADKISVADPIQNTGTLEYTDGESNNDIKGTGILYISGDVVNSTGTKIEQNTIQVDGEGSFVANASDLTASTEILNDGDLEFTGGTNENTISGEGDLTITGAVKNNNKAITQNSIEITTTGSLVTKTANNLTTTNGIVNNGTFEITNGGNNIKENVITGDNGTLILGEGTLYDYANVTQKAIELKKGAVVYGYNTSAADKVTITAKDIEIAEGAKFFLFGNVDTYTKSGAINNDGLFNLNGGFEDTNNNVIKGTGQLLIDRYVVNQAEIKQSTITIEKIDNKVFTLQSDAEKLTAYDKIQNAGGLILTGTDQINTNIIDGYDGTYGGYGYLVIDGTIENALGTSITQSTITINAGKSFTTSADDITTNGDGIINDGTLTFNGGVNTSTITFNDADGELTLNINKDVENTALIAQKAITVADNVKLVTDAGNLADIEDVDQTITLGQDALLNFTDNDEAEDATLTANITGDGYIVKEGKGKVILTGTNDYTGVTTISDGSIEISSADNISENTIYMDGGKLVVNPGDTTVELGNEIVGTFGTDGMINNVEIEVTGDGEAILSEDTSKIYGNGNLVKTGEGTLTLNMAENEYTGDTDVNLGALVGTTANIHGVVTGNGELTSGVEFYDDADIQGDVVLNEIKDMGEFYKTGTSTMTVTNNFNAIWAEISNGTFIIDNDKEMGGSESTFEVSDTMVVENAVLKGYGDISVGKLIIADGATFAPGNSTTTFKLNGQGDFEVMAGGTLDLEFSQLDMDKANEEQTNDKIKANGEATIDSDSKLVLNNTLGKYYVPETFELVEAASMNDFEYNQEGEETSEDKGDYKEMTLGSITFKDYDARELREGYDTRISTSVYVEGSKLMLKLERKASEYGTTAEFERSHNEQEAANAIDAISTGNGGDITLPLDIMEHFFYYKDPETGEANIPELKAALNDVAGVIHANSTMLTFTNDKIEHVYDKIQERTKCLLPCQKAHDKIWAEYYYNTYNVDKNENSPKFDTSVNGFLVGFDMISAKNLTIGVMAGYGTSELKQEQDKTTMNDINFGFYGGYETNKWLFKGMLLGGYEQYSTDRTIGFMDRIANSEHNGYSATLDLEAGYKISLNKKDSQAKHKMYLKPYLGVTGSYMMNEGFEEKNAESLNLKVEDYNAMTAQARAGIGINGKIKKFGWYAKAGVRHYLTEDYNEIESSLLDYKDQTAMKIRSAEMGKLSYGGGLGADFALSNAWTVFANGLASFADNSTNYYGNIGLMYKFGCPNNEKKTDEDVEKISAVLNDKITEEELLRKELKNKDKELEAAKAREKELQDRIQKYEANIVSEQEAQKMKEKTIKTMRLGEKPTFVFGTDKLNGSGKESLKQVARELENYQDAEVLVEGHTDNVGSDEINQKISEQRAASVATSLKKDYGVKNNISVIGKGKTEPIASNDTAEGRAKNRRVEIILTTAE